MTLAELEQLCRDVESADIDTAHDGWCDQERKTLDRAMEGR